MRMFLLSLFLLVSCSIETHSNHQSSEAQYSRNYQVGAYLWFQTSGEYRALCYQAYNLAKLKLARDLEDKHNRKRAVVFDIDETVFDNSKGGAFEIKNHQEYDKSNLNKWVKKAAADAIPGALEFMRFAEENRVEIIYISNRLSSQIDDTIKNLKSLGMPVKKENLYFLKADATSESKESRRLEVLKKYDVVLYFGDNLHDFSSGWDGLGSEERRALVDLRRGDFGDKFIILPNPLYGGWESSLPKNANKEDLLKTLPY